jgi:hypothetical protein
MYTTFAMYAIWNNHSHVSSCSNAFSLFVLLKLVETWCNCECCVIIYKVHVDSWKVMGVVISTLIDGEIVNLEGYGWGLGSKLHNWIQSEFLNHILQTTTLVHTLISKSVMQVWGLVELQPPPQCSCFLFIFLFEIYFSLTNYNQTCYFVSIYIFHFPIITMFSIFFNISILSKT